MAGEGEMPKKGRVKYAYSPHLDPVLRFDPTGRADRVAAVVEKACNGQPLDASEKEILRAVGKNWEQPWLEWANKQEEHARGHFSVDPVALHIHERISAQAILRAAQREDTERSLFAQPEQSYSEALKFYKHDVDWANRLILCDSLQVMSSLAHRENLAGKVQMIYIDPPYGIKFRSNFQTKSDNRSVGESDEDITREPEMLRAYRDTWELGTHSYLAYLTARLKAARQLLSPTGSVFFQISDEQVHRAREVLDSVFDARNFMAHIVFTKTTGLDSSHRLSGRFDHLLWYARDAELAHYQPVFDERQAADDAGFSMIQLRSGERLTRSAGGHAVDGRAMKSEDITKPGPGAKYDISAFGRSFDSGNRWWGTPKEALQRLVRADRTLVSGRVLRFARFADEAGGKKLTNLWQGFAGASDPVYVVQTTHEIVQRAILMTTSPGDLVLDPTCGSGTTAWSAESLGRRWITTDTSRVALAIARSRLLTAQYLHFRTRGGPLTRAGAENPGTGFVYKSVPRVSLSTVAQNANLDPIFAKHEPILAVKLKAANDALASVPAALRATLKEKLAAKEKAEGKKSITDADRRRWILPPDNRDPKEKWTVDAKFSGWYDWEVPFDTDPDWPKPLQDAVTAYRAAWRAKMDEVNKCISDNAEQEELVDQPEVVKGVVRVSGPFTVEGVIPEELSLTEDGAVTDLTPNEFEAEEKLDADRSRQQNAVAYIQRMIEKIRMDGVTFPNNKRMTFTKVESLVDGGEMSGVHASAVEEGKEDATVGIIFGPEFGPVTAQQIEAAVRKAKYYDDIIIAGFAFAPEATAEVENIRESRSTKARLHLAHMRPELNSTMNDLLKADTKGSNQQFFTVFGLPAVSVATEGDGEFTATLEGVDIFNPVEGTVSSTKGEKVSAWFLDSDYDGRCFCACQAFFPNQDAWEKIAKALGSSADPEAFAAFKGRTSLPFRAGKHGRIAVKAIDARGNEVMTVKTLKGKD